MTRGDLLHIPVRFGDEIWPRYRVRQALIDWDAERLTHMVISVGWRRWVNLRLEAGVVIEATEIRASGPEHIEWWSPARARACQRQDWEGCAVEDAGGRLLGRVADVEFDPASGRLLACWISAGVAADLWQGMRRVAMGGLGRRGERIRLTGAGHSPCDEGDER